MRSVMALALLMASFLLGSCDPPRIETPKPPASKLVCEALPTRPALPAEYQIDWSKVTTVDEARAEHERFVATLRDREGRVAGYIVSIEGAWFSCSSNLSFVRTFTEALP